MSRWAKRPAHAVSVVAALALMQSAICGAAAISRAEPAEVAGIRVAFALSALKAGPAKAAAGRDGAFAFTLTTGTAAPLRGAKPAAWLMPHVPGSSLDDRQCRRAAAFLVRGASLAVAAVDLNIFHVLVLGGDASVSVIDPRFGFGGSRLIGLGTFDATATAWALEPDQTILAVAQPSVDQIALLDTRDWSVSARIQVPGAARLAFTPDGRQLLASYRVLSDGKETEGGIAIVDLAAPASTPSRVVTGSGAHEVAVDAEGRFAFVTNAGAGTVSVIDLADKQIVHSVRTGRRPVALAYSALARRAYAAAEDGTVTVISAEPSTPPATIAGPPGLVALRLTPDGRFLLAASGDAGQVIVADTSTDRIVQRIAIGGQPDAIGFSDRVVYVRNHANEFVETFPLDQIGIEGRTPSAMRVGIGQLALGAGRAAVVADVMSPVPGGDGVVIVNSGDHAIYYYREGMAAPSGSFSTYGREPRAVKILDRRLREAEPGVYRTIGRLPRAGTYDVVLYIDNPRIVQCFEARIEPDEAADEGRAATPLVTDLSLSGTPRAGEPLSLHFRLLDPQTGMPMSGVNDARVVSFAIPGQNAARGAARSVGDGAYEAEVTVPAPGNYYVFVEAPSVALMPTAGRLVAVPQ